MSGVDLMDQNTSNYEVDYLLLIFDLMDIGMNNSNMLFII